MATTVTPISRPPTAAPAPQQNRMRLASVERGKREAPVRVLIYGTEGVGKSSFAAGAPSPVFICPEDGTGHLDIARFPEPRSWDDVTSAIRELTTGAHDFKTIVFDTLDWLEPALWAHICQRDKKTDIEAYGYGKGYAAALDGWRSFLAEVETLRRARSMHVVMLAHSWIKSFKNPAGDDYDRYELKVHARAGGLMKEWSDAVLFAAFEEYAVEKDGKVKGVSSGARILRTERTAAWDAKNRFSLPPRLALSWDDFFDAVKLHQTASPEQLRAAIEEKLASLADPDIEAKARPLVIQAGNDSASLANIVNRLNAKLAEREGK